MTVTDQAGITFVAACNRALDDAMAADSSVFLIGQDISDDETGGIFHVTAGLSTKYGLDRVRSTPIAEEAIVGAAVGAALTGMRPVAEIMLMGFFTLAVDQIHNHAAKLRYLSGGKTPVPMTLRMSSGGGGQFAAHHSEQLEAWLAHSPGMKVAIPSSPSDAYGLLTSCIFDDDPCIFIEHTLMNYMTVPGRLPEPGHRVPLGRANIVRPGRDVTVVGYGKPILDIQPLLESLAAEGIDVELIDLRTIAPLDDRTVLESVARTKRAVIIHESRRNFGIGAELAARIHDELFGQLLAPVQRVGAPHTSVPFAAGLEQAYLPGPAQFEAAIRATLAR